MRTELSSENVNVEHSYIKVNKSSLPEEEMYVDGTDFTSENLEKKDQIMKIVEEIFPKRNLKINQDKTEPTELVRGGRNTETWRIVKKWIRDAEDIIRRKQLAIAGMNDLQTVWIRKDHISGLRCLRLNKALVKPVRYTNVGPGV